MYRDPTGPSSGLEALNEVSGRIPVSVIFGGEKDLMYVRKSEEGVLHGNHVVDHILCKMPLWIALLDVISCPSIA